MLINRISIYGLSLWACFFLLFTFACGAKTETEYAGVYKAEGSYQGQRSELELNENGQGIWRVGESEETLSWFKKGNQIRLYTRKGGVIVAGIRDEDLEISIGSGQVLLFKRIE